MRTNAQRMAERRREPHRVCASLAVDWRTHPLEAAELERIKAAGTAATWARQCLARSAKEWAANVAERRVAE